ncbi:MAG: zinc-dependent metalloprotease [Actinomycetota bacterium]
MSDLVDVRMASRFTTRFSGSGDLAGSYLLDGVQDALEEIVREAEPLIAEQSGFHPRLPAVARVLTRDEWAQANIGSMLSLMNPLLDKVESRLSSRALPGARMAYGAALGAQLGTVLGFLSQRVLGQYDILMAHQNQVWFVGPNIVLMERQHGFIPRDFRLWVALHELTHRAQFESNQWVRPYFLSSVEKLIQAMDMDAKTLLERMAVALKGAGASGPAGAPLALRLLEPAQLEQFNRLQAFMSVIEGHGNFVMDRAADGRIPSQPRMSRVLRGGGTIVGPVAKLIGKVLGFELKKAQYEHGQRFFEEVYRVAGSEGVRRCFESAEVLPSLDEVKDPGLWLQRVLV